jgi:hypothetical protein
VCRGGTINKINGGVKMEIWKDIEGYEKSYKISNLGRVKSLSRTIYRSDCKELNIKERILKQHLHYKGYNKVSLSKDSKSKHFFTHRLVAKHFVSNPNFYKEVNHIDGDKINNNYDNLEWCTHQQNVDHAIKNNLYNVNEEVINCKLSNEDVLFIRKNYRPNDKIYGATALANKYNVNNSTISRIARGLKRKWAQ